MKHHLAFLAFPVLSAIAQPQALPARDTIGASWEFDSQLGRYRVEVVATGVQVPFGMAPLPDGNLLVGDRRGGRMYRCDPRSGALTRIEGVPAVYDSLDAGLLDIVVHPQFRTNGVIYFAYVSGSDTGSTTVVERARLSGNRLVERQQVFVAYPAVSTSNHYGARLVLHDGYLFISLGEREVSQLAQELWTDHGKIIRIFDDGRVPPDNPFAGKPGARPEIWSMGHRNPQGLALRPGTAELWENEHGPLGGDEFNIIYPGRNYGWPVITYGREYSGALVGDGLTARDGMEQPVYHYSNSAALTGLLFYTGTAFPLWRNNIFFGAMTPRYLGRLTIGPAGRITEERLLGELRWRIRVVQQAMDDLIYLGVEADASHPDGLIVRLQPVSAR